MSAPIVDGVILAAGLSSRMAQPKPLLRFGTLTFLERAVHTLRAAGCRHIHVVANDGAEWADEAARMLEIRVVHNLHPESEQIDSLRLVIETLPVDTAALLIMPVDLPLILEQTAATVVAAYRSHPGPLLLPFHNGVAGHPVLIGRELFNEILTTPFEEGLRSLIMSHARDLREVRVVDPGILIDIDTPNDYTRFIEQQ